MWPLVLILIYSVLVLLASVAGGMLPTWFRLTHTRMQLAMSAVAGFMLGVALLHMLPHAVAEEVSLDLAVGWALGGLLFTFFLIRAFHFHQHGPVAAPEPEEGDHPDEERVEPADQHRHGGHPPGEAHTAHDHGGHHHQGHEHRGVHRLSWIGVAFGLTIHTLIDGVALAAAVQSEALHAGDSASGLLGIGVFLGVLLHKPLDALSITSVMHAGGWPVERRQLVNFGYALMCPLGALAFWFGTEHVFATHSAIVGCALAFAAGVFLCISLSDLLPELQFHTHDRVKLSVALLAGVLLAYLIGYLEPPHAHPGHPHDAHAHDHDHGAETAAQDAESEHDHTH